MARVFTEDQRFRIQLFRDSVRLQSPDTETDEAYRFTDEQLWTILELVTPVFSPEYSIDTLPGTLFYYPLLLAKKEIYYRLATSTAPFYPLEAEGASLKKNVRFDHYLALVNTVQSEYEFAMEKLAESGGAGGEDGGVVQTYEMTVLSRRYRHRRYNLSEAPKATLEVVTVRTESVDVKWNKFESNKGKFLNYKVYLSKGTEPIIDEYEDHPFNLDFDPVLSSVDIHRNKFRIRGLLPDTSYQIALVVESDVGMRGYSEATIHTPAV